MRRNVAQQTKSKSDRKRSKPKSGKSSGRGRNKSPTPKKERGGSSNGGQRQNEIRNQGGKKTRPEQMYEDYTVIDPVEISDTDEPDVIVDVPVVKVDEIHFELDDLMARVSLHAEVLDLVKLSVGVHAELGKVELNIKGIEAQALMRARLDHVTAIIDRVLTTLDRNPEVLQSIAQALKPVTEGAGKAVGEVGEGANKAVGQIGEGAGSAVEDVGEGAEGAVKDVGKGAGSAVQDVGEGAGGAVKDVGGGAGKAVGEVGEGANKAVGQVGEGAGQAVGGLGEGAGQAVGGLGQGAGALGALAGIGGGGGGGGNGGEGGNGGGNGGGQGGVSGGQIAKQIAKIVAKEIGAAASDEVKDLGLGAAHKAMELGEKRRQRRAEKHNATEAAMRKAQEAGVDIDEVEGTGAEGRVTVHDVEKAAAR
ncbi:MAG TPA: E3 binding domain-containing protein [Solirubrobacterales bacterium]|nr:E3 binding domain-containing protein [Solirubrobacterales bacterium]